MGLIGIILALLAVLLSGGIPILATYSQAFMKALGNCLVTYFPLFMLGATIASLPAFAVVRDAVLGVSANPVISVAVAVNVLAGITVVLLGSLGG